MLSSSLLLLAFLFLSADGRSTSPWNRRLPTLVARTSPSTSRSNHLMLPRIRGGESSSSSSGPASSFSTVPSSSTALPTPASSRIGDSIGAALSGDGETKPESTSHKVRPSITGGHILRADNKADSDRSAATDSEVVVESFVTKKKGDKAAKKLLKRHKQIAKKLKNRNATNKTRKFMHFTWGMLFASLNHFVPRHCFLPGMTIFAGLTLSMELLRYRKGFDWMNGALHFFIGKALRKNEMDGRFTGALYYFSGVTITSYLFPKPCATLGIVQLAIADPTASYFGRATRHVYWSRIGNGFYGMGRNKGILGFLGGAICCVPLNYRLLSLALAKTSVGVAAHTLTKPTVLAISLALGMAGAFADLIVPTPALTLPKTIWGIRVPPFHLDDNIVVPIVSGWACVYIFKLAGISIPPAELALAKYLVV